MCLEQSTKNIYDKQCNITLHIYNKLWKKVLKTQVTSQYYTSSGVILRKPSRIWGVNFKPSPSRIGSNLNNAYLYILDIINTHVKNKVNRKTPAKEELVNNGNFSVIPMCPLQGFTLYRNQTRNRCQNDDS